MWLRRYQPRVRHFINSPPAGQTRGVAGSAVSRRGLQQGSSWGGLGTFHVESAGQAARNLSVGLRWT